MATMQTLLDDLNARLGDANNAAGVGEATKIRWVNHGVRNMWPQVHTVVVDDSTEIVADTYEYDIPAAVGTYSHIVRVEVESDDASGRFYEISSDQLPLLSAGWLQVPDVARYRAGARLRITAIRPIAQMSTVADTFEGQPIHEELPVLYAMYMALSKGHEDRVDHTRYSTVAAQNGVDIGEVEGGALFWLSQFENALDRLAMAWPASVG